MASIFNAQLSELGSSYLVVNVLLTEAKYVLPTAKYFALPTSVALTLKNELNQGKVITIKKDLIDNPKSKDIPLEDFCIETASLLEQKKSAAKAKTQQRISAYSALLTGFDMFEFYMILSKLQSMGYDVMNEANKEEVFLRIIETGDETLISDLERFLEIKDVFNNMMKKYNNIKTYFREINDCDTEEELEEVIELNKGWLIN